MIKDYRYVEIYPEETMRKIINRVNHSIKPLGYEWMTTNNETMSIQSLYNLWNDIKSKKDVNSRQLRSIITFSRFLVWVQKRVGLKVDNNFELLCHPKDLVNELEIRGIIPKDFIEEYPELVTKSIDQIYKGGSMPSWKQLRAFTTLIDESDDLTLDLPPAVGKRWDLDEWIRTSDIYKKESWEQKYD